MYKKELFDFLCSFMTENKAALLKRIVTNRTLHVCIVLEDIFQAQNASAVLRSAECFGIQNVHIIENKYQYELNPDVVVGSNKWINIQTHNSTHHNTADCISSLRKDGYRIIGTSPHSGSIPLANLNIDQRMALVFGNEKEGMSEVAMNLCDDLVYIPMYGFTESFNLSVSAAICMNDIMWRLRNSENSWQLKEDEKISLLLDWAMKSVNNSDALAREFMRRKQIKQ
jgi:tRNA (guanosine-2'-O-)-methyltransferase